jgi:plastocyanin
MNYSSLPQDKIVLSSLIITTIIMSIIIVTSNTGYGQRHDSNVNSAVSNTNISYTRTTSSSVTATGVTDVSIQPGAATLGYKSFLPNPVNVRVGDTITWINNDDSSPAFHTVTSGFGSNDTNLGRVFDSGLSGPNALTTVDKMFSHTFTSAGEFPYFCQLHPTMIGMVIVSK